MDNEKPIKQIMKENRVTQWEIAEEIGMHESTLSRKLRTEPDAELRGKIIEAIKAVKSRLIL